MTGSPRCGRNDGGAEARGLHGGGRGALGLRPAVLKEGSPVLTDGLIFPALGLACLGWLVPRLLSTFWPEGLRPLVVLTLVAAALLFVLAGAMFIALYVMGGVPLAALIEPGVLPFLEHFSRLGAVSALFWAPMMLLSVIGLPKYWVRERW